MLEKLRVINNVRNTSQVGCVVNKMNRKSHIVCFLAVSDCSTLPLQIFLRKVFGGKQQISWIHVCRAWPLGFRSLSCQRGRHLLLALIIERLRDGKTLLSAIYLPANPIHGAVYLQHVLESTKSCSSVDSAFYAIKWAHEIAGMASPTDNQVVSRVREAAKRII